MNDLEQQLTDLLEAGAITTTDADEVRDFAAFLRESGPPPGSAGHDPARVGRCLMRTFESRPQGAAPESDTRTSYIYERQPSRGDKMTRTGTAVHAARHARAGGGMRPRLLDLFCGAGGCSVGYARAGFEVVGVDIEPHLDYPYWMHVRDALDVLADRDFLAGFDAVHASPPCQAYTTMGNRRRGDWPDLIDPVRDALLEWGGTYVIENVPGARSKMRDPITLHGGMFGLGVDRPRLFETNAALMLSTAPRTTNPIGVYGRVPDGRLLWTRADGTEQRAASSTEEAAQAMGIDWMADFRDIAEAIPPAYTEYIGAQLIEWIGVAP